MGSVDYYDAPIPFSRCACKGSGSQTHDLFICHNGHDYQHDLLAFRMPLSKLVIAGTIDVIAWLSNANFVPLFRRFVCTLVFYFCLIVCDLFCDEALLIK